MAAGRLSRRRLTQAYLRRIRRIDLAGIQLNSVIELNPDALEIAAGLDAERRQGRLRGPPHGIPILVKDNFDTRDKMATTAGSLVWSGPRCPGRVRGPAAAPGRGGHPRQDQPVGVGQLSLHPVLQRLVGPGPQCLSPYVLDHNPCGSSSGSGTAVANLAAASLGTETDGSIVCPSSHNALVGIKPTLGLTSRSGWSRRPQPGRDRPHGPHRGRDAATVLGAMTGVDPRDPATASSRGHSHRGYSRFLNPHGLRGARSAWREGVFGASPEADVIGEAAIAELSRLGATVVDPADIPNVNDIGGPERTVLLCEFKDDIAAYLSQRRGSGMRTLADLIAFNEANAEREPAGSARSSSSRPRRSAASTTLAYAEVPLATSSSLATGGIDQTMDRHRPGRRLQPHRQPALDHRPGQRRPLPAGQLDPGGRGRLSEHHRARRLRSASPGRGQLHRPPLVRADPRQAGRRLRARNQGPPRPPVPAHPGRQGEAHRLLDPAPEAGHSATTASHSSSVV